MLELSEVYQWDKAVFEKAYKDVIASDFKFKIELPSKLSRDKKKSAKLSIEKTETITSVYTEMEVSGTVSKIKLFDKKNVCWYDCIYKICPFNKWFDNDKFGIHYRKGQIDIWYSIEKMRLNYLKRAIA